MRRLAPALVLLAALAPAPSAGARIVPGQSIGGVRLGMTEAQVRKVLGTPLGVEQRRGRFGARRLALHFGYAAYDVELEARRSGALRVVEIATGLRSERLPNGIAVGATEFQAAKALKELRCARPVQIVSPRTGDVIGFRPRTCTLRGQGAETVFFVSPRRRFSREARWRPREAVVLEVRIRAV
jgi:hypothetical protein